MIEDGRNIPQGHILRTQVCIIGAGAAGITLALELAAQGLNLILLEAGGLKAEPTSHDDLAGEVVSPEHHDPLTECRSRQLGGATALWVGCCLPLDPLDLERRDHVPDSGWPIGWSELAPWYPRANRYCHLGADAYTLAEALPGTPAPLAPGFRDGALIGGCIERWSLPTRFGVHYRDALSVSRHIRVLLHAVCTQVNLDPERRRVGSLAVATTPERRFQVRARTFVIAGGGLETTRLLLASKTSAEPTGIGNRYDRLGRYYMGHAAGSVAEIRFHGDPRRTRYGYEPDADGVYCRRRIRFAPETQRREGLLNTAFYLTNPSAADPKHRNGILSAGYIALSLPYLRERLAVPPVIRRIFCGEPTDRSWWPHVRNILCDLPRTSLYLTRFVSRRLFAARRIPTVLLYNPANRYGLRYSAEQTPNPDSRVVLADDLDRFGMPRLRVDLRYRDQDIDSLARAHQVLAEEMERQGVATVSYKRDQVRDHILEQAIDGYHQLGTTRMAASEREGVVDPDCRVHGVGNLYVCSSSVFPTAGHANPTLTIVALAARLAITSAASTVGRAEYEHFGGTMTRSSETRPGRATKVLMLGIDAGDLLFIQGHEDHLPAFRRLLREGRLRRLETTSRLLPGSIGPTFYTGSLPGEHGIYHHHQWDQERMQSRRVNADWLYREPFWYELARSSVRVTVVDGPMVFPSRLERGAEVVNWGSHDQLTRFHCNRPELARDIRRRFGRHAMGIEVPVTKSGRQLARICSNLVTGARQKGELIRYMMAQTEWDFFLAMFGESHRGGHMLWPEANPASVVPPAALLDVYRAIDQALDAILEAVDAATTQVLVFSLHGMQSNRSQEHLVVPVMQRINALYGRQASSGGPEPARQRSLMRLLRRRLPARLQHAIAQGAPVEVRDWVVNRATSGGYRWEQTPALPLRTDNNGYLRFNLEGRESAGCLRADSPEYLNYRDWLVDGFRGLRAPDGAPLVDEIASAAEAFPGKHSAKLPDLIVTWTRQPPVIRAASDTLGRFSVAPDSGRSGYHRHEGFVVIRGPGQGAEKWQSVGHIKDLARVLLGSFAA